MTALLENHSSHLSTGGSRCRDGALGTVLQEDCQWDSAAGTAIRGHYCRLQGWHCMDKRTRYVEDSTAERFINTLLQRQLVLHAWPGCRDVTAGT